MQITKELSSRVNRRYIRAAIVAFKLKNRWKGNITSLVELCQLEGYDITRKGVYDAIHYWRRKAEKVNRYATVSRDELNSTAAKLAKENSERIAGRWPGVVKEIDLAGLQIRMLEGTNETATEL